MQEKMERTETTIPISKDIKAEVNSKYQSGGSGSSVKNIIMQ